MSVPSVDRSLFSFVRKADPFIVTVLFFALPFALFFVALGVDLVSWSFTGHELLPWIGRGIRGN